MRKKILIIKHGSFGDIILSCGPISAIRKNHQNAHITILTEKTYNDFFLLCPWIDKIKIDNRYSLSSPRKCIKMYKWLYNSDFNWVYDLQTSFRSSFYFHLIPKSRKPKWNGIAKGCSHRHENSNRTSLHTVERHKEQLKIAGINKIQEVDWSWLRSNKKKFILKHEYALIVPGGSKKRERKRWPINNYKELVKKIIKNNVIPIIVGTNEEIEMTNQISDASEDVINLVGKTNYGDLADLARNCKYSIGNDTGPMHLIAKVAKKKSKKIILFGQDSNPLLCAPRGEGVIIIKKDSITEISVNHVLKNLNLKY